MTDKIAARLTPTATPKICAHCDERIRPSQSFGKVDSQVQDSGGAYGVTKPHTDFYHLRCFGLAANAEAWLQKNSPIPMLVPASALPITTALEASEDTKALSLEALLVACDRLSKAAQVNADEKDVAADRVIEALAFYSLATSARGP